MHETEAHQDQAHAPDGKPYATLPDDGPSGGYFEDAGVIPW